MSELYLEFVKSLKEILTAIYKDILKKKENY